MSIRLEETPNPNTIKFFVDKKISDSGGHFYTSKNDAVQCMIVRSLFDVDGVKSVFLGSDFISITKYEELNWESLKERIVLLLMDYFASPDIEIFSDSMKVDSEKDIQLDFDDDVVKQIHQIIEERVRPVVMQDGGNVVFKAFKDGIVYLRMQGACAGCPSASYTLKDGIKNILQYYVDEVKDVEQVE